MRVQLVSPNRADRLDPLRCRRDSVSSLLSPLDAGGPGWGGSGRMRGAGQCGRMQDVEAGRTQAWLGRGERMRGGAGHQDGRALTAEAERWGRTVLCASGWATTGGGRWVEAG